MRTIVSLDRLDGQTVAMEFTDRPDAALFAAAALARAEADEAAGEPRDDAAEEAAALRSLADDLDHYAESSPISTTVDQSYGWRPAEGGSRPRLTVWHQGQPKAPEIDLHCTGCGAITDTPPTCAECFTLQKRAEAQPTCDDRIDDQAAGRLSDLATLVAIVQADDDPDTIADLTVGELRRLEGLGVTLPDLLSDLVTKSHAADDDTAESLHALRAGVDIANDPVDGWPDDFQPLCDVLRDEGTGLLADAAREALEEYGLSVDVETTRVLRWVFSTGGPHDEIEMAVDRGAWSWDIEQATFVFQDWFDGARKPLTGDELETVRQAAEIVGFTEPGSLLPERDDVA